MSEDVIVKIDGMDIVVKDARFKVGIGISIGGTVHPEFLKMIFARNAEWSRLFTTTMIIDTMIPLDLSRNTVVNSAKRQNCDYLFFIDSDILIEPGHLERLLSQGKDVISGVYYQRISPYHPLPRKRVSQTLYSALELDENDVVEIDGNGLGCFLVKMDVFDKIPFPWFEFKYFNNDGKWVQVSEDLYLCQKLQDAGIKIYCDTAVQCSHIGTIVSPQLGHIYKAFRSGSAKERERTVLELSEYTGISLADIYDKWMYATESVAKDYVEFRSQNHRDPKDFYKINKNYVFDLTHWHTVQRRDFDISIVRSIKEKYPIHWLPKKILDFGSGCGQNAIELAEAGYDVSMSDYEGYTSEFAKFRTKKRGLDIKFYDIEKPIKDKFDIILAFDVLDYVPDSEFEKTIELLKGLRTEQGEIIVSTSFGNQEGLYPMRYDSTHEKVELIEKLRS